MALVVICGQPCSGKSTAAACLADALQAMDPKPTVRIIDESSLHLGRNQSYAGTLSHRTCDCICHGYRYELWCLARSSGIRYCMVINYLCCFSKCFVTLTKIAVGNGTESVGKWENLHMTQKCKFEDLVRRFEKPDRRNRWDSPLFELFPSKEPADVHFCFHLQEVINMIVEAQSQGLAGAVSRISLGQHLPAISFFLEAKWSAKILVSSSTFAV
ncbi:hypothetical protein BHE74_00016452 [Ensete ventricosum]|nr:hypothetical protein GW17_00026507 [Ensete ventricosum]RWW75544.1 hypothetical protein BHE74_00016452 [Ensete ventricosum]RZR90265.1 hypothetical protein BHM03_00018126 [Ensete ventricosum]